MACGSPSGLSRTQPGLHSIAQLGLAPKSAGLLAADDLEQLEAGMLLHNVCRRWARDATAEAHGRPAPERVADD